MVQAQGEGRERLSACLIVQNEQDNMAGALDSVSFCDEVIVVDGGSTDRTVEIARAQGATVIENPWPGFAAQRNVALDAARGTWVLELDADERVTPLLRASIDRLLASPPPEAAIAVFPLRHRFLGRLLGPSGKYPAYRSRLFKPSVYRHDEARGVHEGIEPRERPVVLEGELEHELARTLGGALRDAWSYARLESTHLARPSSGMTYAKGMVVRPIAKIAYRTVVERGWRDGWQGMLKIVLDASSDALVWVLVLLGRGGAQSGANSNTGMDSSPAHFGRRPSGPPKVVALAGRGAPAETARAWLEGLRAQGIDVALLSDENAPTGSIPWRRVDHLRPMPTMRALDVEMQIRTIHAVVAFGQRARLVWRFLPGTLRPFIAGLDATTNTEQPIAEKVMCG
ncbi:MAG: glycosyltransferase family 2 protein [Solirubrobacteraceae bacterium]